jgi:hypothetical protein
MPVPATDFARRLGDLSAQLAKKIMRLSAPLNEKKLGQAIQASLIDAMSIGTAAAQAAVQDATATRAAWLKDEYQGLYTTAIHDALLSLTTFRVEFDQAWPDVAAAALEAPVAPRVRTPRAAPENGEPEPDAAAAPTPEPPAPAAVPAPTPAAPVAPPTRF